MKNLRIPDLKKLYDDYIESTITSYPVRSTWISQIGDPCERKLVYNRTHYEHKQKINVSLKKIFNEGVDQEASLIERLKKALQHSDYQIVCEQKPVEIKEYKLSGRIDGEIIHKDQRIPLEIKTCSPHTFSKFNSVDDFQRFHWSKKYPAQLILYMYINNSAVGMFVLKDKSSGDIKSFPIYLDEWLEYCEELLQKSERIEKHAEAKTLPERHQVYEDCIQCEYKHLCLPALETNGIELEDDKELENKLRRHNELKPFVSEYNKIDSILKKQLEGKEALVGKYLIGGKWIIKKLPATKEKEIKYWSKNIECLE